MICAAFSSPMVPETRMNGRSRERALRSSRARKPLESRSSSCHCDAGTIAGIALNICREICTAGYTAETEGAALSPLKHLLTFAIVLGLSGASALAQYPAKPVRLVIHFPAGGSTDLVARTLAQALSESLGQPFVVEKHLATICAGRLNISSVKWSAP